jgi:hypothetical protein
MHKDGSGKYGGGDNPTIANGKVFGGLNFYGLFKNILADPDNL